MTAESAFDLVRECVDQERPVVVATVIGGALEPGARMLLFEDGTVRGALGQDSLTAAATKQARAALERGSSRRATIPVEGVGDVDVFYDVHPAPPTLLIFGGVHIGIPLARFAKLQGFRVRVIDARGRFANQERFPDADEIHTDYAEDYLSRVPIDSSCYVVVLSHDPKLDDPALMHVVRTPARYIGAIGSRSTNQKRRERLLAAGVPQQLLDRIHAPVGLDIGAETPEEIALAILAEMIAAKNGRDYRPLPSDTEAQAAGVR